MSDEDESGLLAIEVDADDYAEAAAGDTPSVSRTFQSEADFQAIKAAYTSKSDGGKGQTYRDLIDAVPVLCDDTTRDGDGAEAAEKFWKIKLTKKQVQLLGYAVGEMYFDREFERVIGLCGHVREKCEVDGKMGEMLGRWVGRCEVRLGR